jgi:hypothetical protein
MKKFLLMTHGKIWFAATHGINIMNTLKADLFAIENIKDLSIVFDKFRKGSYELLTGNMIFSTGAGSVFLLDRFNQVSVANISEKSGKSILPNIKAFGPLEVFNSYEISWSPMVFPDHTCICDHCGKGWDLSNITKGIRINPASVTEERKFKYNHQECAAIKYDAELSSELIKAFKTAGIDLFQLQQIDNSYTNNNLSGHWYSADTSIGQIITGWRKRVMHLEFVNLKPYLQDIIRTGNTIGDSYVHAYSYEELTEYLKTVRLYLENKNDGT